MCKQARLLQYMAGGDLGTALSLDAQEREGKSERRLGWYARGRVVLLCVARGLAYLHSERVCIPLPPPSP